MTTWWELGLAVIGWTLMCFGLFSLGRWWERDHPKIILLPMDSFGPPWNEEDHRLMTRRGIYDQALEGMDDRLKGLEYVVDREGHRVPAEDLTFVYGPHRRG